MICILPFLLVDVASSDDEYEFDDISQEILLEMYQHEVEETQCMP